MVAAQKCPEDKIEHQASLAFRDEIGGAAVNIVPSERPSDIYQLVANKAIEQLEKMTVANEPEAQMQQEDDEVSDAELAQWWLITLLSS